LVTNFSAFEMRLVSACVSGMRSPGRPEGVGDEWSLLVLDVGRELEPDVPQDARDLDRVEMDVARAIRLYSSGSSISWSIRVAPRPTRWR
jgi:hypothetical protein